MKPIGTGREHDVERLRAAEHVDAVGPRRVARRRELQRSSPSSPPISAPSPNRSTAPQVRGQLGRRACATCDRRRWTRAPCRDRRPRSRGRPRASPTASRSTSTPLATRENHAPSGERAMNPPSPVSDPRAVLRDDERRSAASSRRSPTVVTPPSRQRYSLPSPPSTTISSLHRVDRARAAPSCRSRAATCDRRARGAA